MAFYHKWNVKNDFTYVLKFVLLISDGQYGVNWLTLWIREIRASNCDCSILTYLFGINILRRHSITNWTRREGEGVSRNSTLGHVTKGRCHVKCPQLSTRGGMRSK